MGLSDKSQGLAGAQDRHPAASREQSLSQGVP